jgi:outer membrane protein
MKNVSVILTSLALALSGLFFSCKNQAGPSGTTSTTVAAPTGSPKLAYVNIDSFENNYTYMKTRQEEFKKRQEQMEGELQHSFQQLQADAADVQKKAQGGTLTQAEYNMAEKRLMQLQQSLETRKQALSEQLLKERDEFNKNLKSDFDAFFEEYNKTHHYDFIYYYSASASSLLYVNKQLDITREVIEGMNEMAKNKGKK